MPFPRGSPGSARPAADRFRPRPALPALRRNRRETRHQPRHHLAHRRGRGDGRHLHPGHPGGHRHPQLHQVPAAREAERRHGRARRTGEGRAGRVRARRPLPGPGPAAFPAPQLPEERALRGGAGPGGERRLDGRPRHLRPVPGDRRPGRNPACRPPRCAPSPTWTATASGRCTSPSSPWSGGDRSWPHLRRRAPTRCRTRTDTRPDRWSRSLKTACSEALTARSRRPRC